MNRITHRYYVSLQLLERIEKFINDNNPDLEKLKLYFRKQKLYYRCGLAHLDD